MRYLKQNNVRYNRRKYVGVFFDSPFQLLLTYKMRTLSFTRQCKEDVIQVRWKTFALLYDKFTQDHTHQLLTDLASFVEDTTKTCSCFFRFTV